jgi:hypothetical protein
LHNARVSCRRRLSELRVDLGAFGIEPGGCIPRAALRVVERIVSFRAELETQVLAARSEGMYWERRRSD